MTFLVTGIIYTLVILYTREKMSNEMHYYKYLGFKKNSYVLATLIFNQTHYEIPITDCSLVFGKRDSSIRITAFLSLHCSHCARAFEKIKDILKSEADVAINVILITSDTKILNTLYHYNQLRMDDEALSLLYQWYSMDSYSRAKMSETLCIIEADDISKGVSNENMELYKSCNVIGTPTFFINGYLLPSQYEIGDIKYFTEVFLRKEEIVAGSS
ncbi:MAG TPA: thioredoxin domain-containing protein [Methanobacteriaceae archaeon]|nr:thioredoxin domain-containing protein [Methanobacteriaceae archaeon]